MRHFILFLLLCYSSQITASDEIMEIASPITFPTATQLSKHTIRMPFSMAGNLITVQAQVNGITGAFIIDTGSYTMVLNKRIYGAGKSNRKTIYSVNKEMMGVEEAWIHDFRVNDFEINANQADLMDLSHIEIAKKKRINGILGYKNLKPFEIYIDFYLNQITLFKTKSNGDRHDLKFFTDQIKDTLQFQRKRHSIILKLNVSGEKLDFVLDTGAEINQLSKKVSARILKNFTPLEMVDLVGMDGLEKEVLAGTFDPFNSTQETKPMPTIISTMEFARQAFGTKVDGVLGYWYLMDKRILINYKKKSLYFATWPQ